MTAANEELRKEDRRKTRRMVEPLSILVFWTGNSGRHAADMCDISPSGCYLNTSGAAETGEMVTVEIPETPDSDVIMSISGTVIIQARKFVGFGLHFESQSQPQIEFIERLMQNAKEPRDRRSISENPTPAPS